MIPISVTEKVKELSYLIAEQHFDVEFIDSETTILRGFLRFIDGSIHHFMEYTSPDNHSYRFHFMDENKDLIRRWDSAPHHKEVETFPFHIHTPEGVKSCEESTFNDVLERVEEILLERFKK